MVRGVYIPRKKKFDTSRGGSRKMKEQQSQINLRIAADGGVAEGGSEDIPNCHLQGRWRERREGSKGKGKIDSQGMRWGTHAGNGFETAKERKRKACFVLGRTEDSFSSEEDFEKVAGPRLKKDLRRGKTPSLGNRG